MTPAELGVPAPSDLPTRRCRASRQVMVGSLPVSCDAPVSVQTMTNTRASGHRRRDSRRPCAVARTGAADCPSHC